MLRRRSDIVSTGYGLEYSVIGFKLVIKQEAPLSIVYQPHFCADYDSVLYLTTTTTEAVRAKWRTFCRLLYLLDTFLQRGDQLKLFFHCTVYMNAWEASMWDSSIELLSHAV